MRNPTPGASPHSTEAATNPARPAMNIAPPPVPVPGAAAEEEEGRQGHQVAVEDPLEAPDRGVQVAR